MKAIVQQNNILGWHDIPEPVPSRGEVLIRIKATAVNRADLAQRRGQYPPPKGETDIMGLECAGVIESVGEGVSQYTPGDRVCALLTGGGYAERVVVPAGQVLPIPGTLDFAQASSLPEAFATAYLNIFLEALAQRGETVLIHAGASGVGTAAIQLCRAFRSPCFVTVGDERKVELCKSLGAETGWVRTKSDFSIQVNEISNGRGVDVILDPVGSSYLKQNLACLAVDGRLVFIGVMGGSESTFPIRDLMVKRQRLIGSTLRARSISAKARIMDGLRTRVWPLVASEHIRPVIHRVYPIQDVEQAHVELANNQTVGKIVLMIE